MFTTQSIPSLVFHLAASPAPAVPHAPHQRRAPLPVNRERQSWEEENPRYIPPGGRKIH